MEYDVKPPNRIQVKSELTNEFLDELVDFFFQANIRVERKRAYMLFREITKLPYKFLIEKNREIPYRGQGVHINSEHGNQLLSIWGVGKYEVKAVSSSKDKAKTPKVKFTPSADIKKLVKENVRVIEDGE